MCFGLSFLQVYHVGREFIGGARMTGKAICYNCFWLDETGSSDVGYCTKEQRFVKPTEWCSMWKDKNLKKEEGNG